ncbi:MAG: sodium/proline symporter [Gemmatimonadota bacterium]
MVIRADGYAVAAFLGYLVLVVGIGAYSARFSSRGIGNYFVGGRAMNRWVVALSAVVSGRSAWLLLGVTGMAWTMGVSAVWAVAGYTFVEFFLFFHFAPRLRRLAEARECITLTDVFAERFRDERGALRLVLSTVIVIFMTAYVSAQFVGGGKAIGASFGLDPQTGVVLTAFVVLAYTSIGGFLAVSLTDTVQAVFMIFALVVTPILAIAGIGGLDAVLTQVAAYDPSFLDLFSLGAGALLGMVGIGLGSPGNPHILVRYISIGDPRELRWAAWTGTAANLLMGGGAVLIGLVGRVYFPEISMLPAEDTENLYPLLAEQTLPSVLFGMVVASIFAAIMSTADSQLLVGASAVVRDVYEKVIRRGQELPERRLVILSRAVVAVLVGAALLLGWVAEDLVFWLVLFAWAGLGAALGPTTLLMLYWRGTTLAGVIAGLLTGTITTIVWYLTPVLRDFLYELIPAFILAALVTWVVSRMTRPPDGVEEDFRIMGDRPGDAARADASTARVREEALRARRSPSPGPGEDRPPPGGPPRPGR